MNIEHYKKILSLYKRKVQGIDIFAELKELHQEALFELDKLIVNSQSTNEVEEYINELNTLLYEYF